MADQAGNYYGRLTSIETVDPGDGKSPYTELVFNVTHRQEGNAWAPLPNTIERSTRHYLSEKAWDYTMRDFETLGFNLDFEKPVFSKLQGNVALVCAEEVYNGKAAMRWKIAALVTQSRQSGGAPAGSGLLLQLTARAQAGKMQNPPVVGVPAAPPAPAAAQTGGDDEPPF